MQSLLSIGASKDGIEAARDSILMIMKAGEMHEASVTCAALKALRVLCSVNNTTITGCSFTNQEKVTKPSVAKPRSKR